MKDDDKFQFVIPSKLAYGPQSIGQKIGPNATLIFDVELLAIEKKQSVSRDVFEGGVRSIDAIPASSGGAV